MIKTQIIGNLTSDPKEAVTNGGTKLVKFTIASNRVKNGEKVADFIDVTAFGKLAEVCEKYLAKGKKVFVDGDLVSNTYTKDDHKQTWWSVQATSVEFLCGIEQPKTPDSNIDDLKPCADEMPF